MLDVYWVIATKVTFAVHVHSVIRSDIFSKTEKSYMQICSFMYA